MEALLLVGQNTGDEYIEFESNDSWYIFFYKTIQSED